MQTITSGDLKKEYNRGYSSGYNAGKKADIDEYKTEVYQTMIIEISKMYNESGWGRKVNGQHKKFTPEECMEEAILQANKLIGKVSIK